MKRAALLIGLAAVSGARLAAQTPPCCSVTAIEAATGVVSGKVTANSNVFQFKVTNARTLASLKVGQAVYVNFTTHQVSLDGRAACCTVSSGPSPAAKLPLTPAPSPATAIGVNPANRVPATSLSLPTITYGTPHAPLLRAANVTVAQLARYDNRSITAVVGGRNVSGTILHLRGLDGIEKAPGLPEGARRLLKMHVRQLQPGESDHYIVNLDLANAWFQTHTVPADIQPVDENASTHSGCSKWTWHCAGEVVAHAEDQASQIIQQAQAAWNHASSELATAWNTVAACLADHTLPLNNIPLQFSVSPQMPIHLEASGSKDLGGGGSASGTVQGTVTLSLPVSANMTSDLDLFYIPCLPFVVRPRSISTDGIITVAEDIKGDVSASGKFDKDFPVPPVGGAQILIEVIPIVIAGVPVAELDVSAFIGGDIEVGGSGKVDGHFEVTNPHQAHFTAQCDGKNCSAVSKGMPDPSTASEGASIQGQVFVRPAILTAVQLDFDIDALTLRAGPEPYLLGTAAGCTAVAGTQTMSGGSTSSENHVLAADLDWGVSLVAEALIAGKTEGQTTNSITGNKHLWFRDLAPGGSTALDALAVSTSTAVAHKVATFKVRMPSCYPYTGAMKYQVTWTGSAMPEVNPACTWQIMRGTCTFDPAKDLVIGMSWPASGAYTLTVVATGDVHDNTTRVFQPAPTPQPLSVTVSAGP
jgi:hypothetical protein